MNALYDFYTTDLRPVLIEQERKRKYVVRDVKRVLIAIFLLASTVLLDWLRKVGFKEENLYAVLILYIPAIALAFFINRSIVKWHTVKAKQVTISKVVQFIDPGLDYSAGGMVPQTSIRSSGFFPVSTILEGEDLITGHLHGLRFACSEVLIKRDEKKNKHFANTDVSINTPIFRGLFAEIELPERVNSVIYIFPKNLANAVKGRLGMLGATGSNLERIKLEDPMFERYFIAYASDQLQSRMVLTTKLIEDITSLREKMNVGIMLSIKHSKLYIAVPSSQDLFEPNVFKSYLNPDYVRNYLKELQIVTDLVEDVREIFRLS